MPASPIIMLYIVIHAHIPFKLDVEQDVETLGHFFLRHVHANSQRPSFFFSLETSCVKLTIVPN